MSRSGRRLTPDEEALWRRVARDVVRTRQTELTLLEDWAAPAPSAPASNRAPPSQAQATIAKTGPVAYRGGEKRVRRGRLSIEVRLDLHGMTQDRARGALLSAIERGHGDGARLMLVITGKGGADGRGVLRRRLPAWLGEPAFRKIVSGYAEAHARHGGGGAFYVFLRAQS